MHSNIRIVSKTYSLLLSNYCDGNKMGFCNERILSPRILSDIYGKTHSISHQIYLFKFSNQDWWIPLHKTGEVI
jgi:hypothetical protein